MGFKIKSYKFSKEKKKLHKLQITLSENIKMSQNKYFSHLQAINLKAKHVLIMLF